MKKKFRTFTEGRKFAHSLHIKSSAHWKKFIKLNQLPDDIPRRPSHVYKKQWKSWGDWLGTHSLSSKQKHQQFLPYEKARKYVRSLNLKNLDEWNDYIKSGKLPINIPASPYSTYKNKGWVSAGDWLGTNFIATFNRTYLSFEKARKYVHSLNFSNRDEWDEFKKSNNLPLEIPRRPSKVYKKQWKGWGDFLGTGNISMKNTSKQFLTFKEARKYVRALNLQGENEWNWFRRSGKKPSYIPSDPRISYKNKGWINMGDWLGTGSIASYKRKYKAFEDARKYVRSLGLKSQKEWRDYCKSGKKPNDIPSAPWTVYLKKK